LLTIVAQAEITDAQGEVQVVHLPKSREELTSLFAQRGIQLAQQSGEGQQVVAAMCGSGVTACPLALILHTFGLTDVPVYDGSWHAPPPPLTFLSFAPGGGV
jgi:hypothetical protein